MLAAERILPMYYTTTHDQRLKPLARRLRKNMTAEERHLWFQFLQHYPIRFLRQKPIQGYIVDFYCAKARLVVEIDGSQHFDPAHKAYDAERTRRLMACGMKVLRFTNREIWTNFSGVQVVIDQEVRKRVRE